MRNQLKISMVIGETQKPLHIFSRAGSYSVPDSLHIRISHFHALVSQELYSPLEQGTFFGLNFRSNSRKRANTLRRLAMWS